MKETIYDFNIIDNKGICHSMSEFKGKILLIVNTAIHCSFVNTYLDLEKTYLKFHKENFEILDFPCDQFHGECPENDSEIEEFIQSNFKTSFLRLKKTQVNGEHADPLFLFLQKKRKFRDFDKGNPSAYPIISYHLKKDPLWREKSDIKWNFTKFLIDREGNVVKRFECTSKEKNIDAAIEHIIDTQL